MDYHPTAPKNQNVAYFGSNDSSRDYCRISLQSVKPATIRNVLRGHGSWLVECRWKPCKRSSFTYTLQLDTVISSSPDIVYAPKIRRPMGHFGFDKCVHCEICNRGRMVFSWLLLMILRKLITELVSLNVTILATIRFCVRLLTWPKQFHCNACTGVFGWFIKLLVAWLRSEHKCCRPLDKIAADELRNRIIQAPPFTMWLPKSSPSCAWRCVENHRVPSISSTRKLHFLDDLQPIGFDNPFRFFTFHLWSSSFKDGITAHQLWTVVLILLSGCSPFSSLEKWLKMSLDCSTWRTSRTPDQFRSSHLVKQKSWIQGAAKPAK